MKRVLLTAVLALAMAGSAEAAVPYEPGPAMRGWIAVAEARFPDHCEPVSIVVDEAQYDESLSAFSTPSSCQITLFPRFWEQRRNHRCAIIVHEYGHLSGLEHSDDIRSIMHPAAPWWGARRCVRR